MSKVKNSLVLLCSFVLILATGISLAANAPSSKESSAKPASKLSSKSTKPQKKTEHQATRPSTKNHVFASAEELGGTVGLVAPSDKEITLVGANGVPYDFHLSRTTKVECEGKKIKATELAEENKQLGCCSFSSDHKRKHGADGSH